MLISWHSSVFIKALNLKYYIFLCSLESGEVYSVRKIDDNRLYALKLINVTDGHRDFSRKFYLGSYAQSLVDELEVIIKFIM